MSNELFWLSLKDAARLLKSRQLSPVELTQASLSRIDQTEHILNSFITLNEEAAHEAAKVAESTIQSGGYLGPLHGIPVALKDLFATSHIRTTLGASFNNGVIPAENSTAASRLELAGAILIGKTNLNELAFGATGENPHYGDSNNPWNPAHISGGSSGGSGSATASGQCAMALGTDTGGSVRIPSSLCGLTGLKPTYGRISVNGVTPLAWSLDHVGILARSVEDSAIVLQSIAGYDPSDPTSLDAPVPQFANKLRPRSKGFRIGIPTEFVWDQLSPVVNTKVRAAINELSMAGVPVSEISIPCLASSIEISASILGAEAHTTHAQTLHKHEAELDPNVRQRLERGRTISTAEYIHAQQDRLQLRHALYTALSEVDLLVMPTCTIVAPPHGADLTSVETGTVEVLAALTRLTRLSNLTGFPSLSVPCGFSDDGLPIGLQIIGRPLDEQTVLRAGYLYQTITDWHLHRPQLGT